METKGGRRHHEPLSTIQRLARIGSPYRAKDSSVHLSRVADPQVHHLHHRSAGLRPGAKHPAGITRAGSEIGAPPLNANTLARIPSST
jgi:hypothetical protein